jgi:hypothetical protein
MREVPDEDRAFSDLLEHDGRDFGAAALVLHVGVNAREILDLRALPDRRRGLVKRRADKVAIDGAIGIALPRVEDGVFRWVYPRRNRMLLPAYCSVVASHVLIEGRLTRTQPECHEIGYFGLIGRGSFSGAVASALRPEAVRLAASTPI